MWCTVYLNSCSQWSLYDSDTDQGGHWRGSRRRYQESHWTSRRRTGQGRITRKARLCRIAEHLIVVKPMGSHWMLGICQKSEIFLLLGNFTIHAHQFYFMQLAGRLWYRYKDECCSCEWFERNCITRASVLPSKAEDSLCPWDGATYRENTGADTTTCPGWTQRYLYYRLNFIKHELKT
jgi:hypothetical protein